MTEVNRVYFRHQLIAGLVTGVGAFGRLSLQLKVYYFNPRPCLDHLAHRPSPPTQGSEGEDDQLLDAGRSTQIAEGDRSARGRGQSSASDNEQTDGDDIELLIPGEDAEEPEEVREASPSEKSRALELLLKYSENYMRDYIARKLPLCDTERHVRQVPCLCQYVEERTAVV